MKNKQDKYDVEVVNTKYGRFMLRRVDLVSRRVAEGVFWDACLKKIFDKVLKKGCVCVDVGANIGFHTVYMSKLVRGVGKVFSIEALPYVYYQLCGNVYLNDCFNVTTFNVAAYNKSCKMRVADPNDQDVPLKSTVVNYRTCKSVGSIALCQDDEGVIQGVCLDEIVPVDVNVSLIKVDVQGCDLKALIGLHNTISRCRPVILFEFDDHLSKLQGHTWKDHVGFFDYLGYGIKALGKQNYFCESK